MNVQLVLQGMLMTGLQGRGSRCRGTGLRCAIESQTEAKLQQPQQDDLVKQVLRPQLAAWRNQLVHVGHVQHALQLSPGQMLAHIALAN